ncbi:MAG: helix-turn-helix transcriptional regulator [Eubacteriaceae bacterium]|nr:helix-turn-helix transcriptional regulator [Eubacteriaceae bacterium]
MEDMTFSFDNLEQVNKIILNIYDSELPIHTRISNFFEDISSFIYYDRASIMIFFKNENGEYEKQSSFTVNWNSSLLKKYDVYYARLDDSLEPLDHPKPMVIKSSSFFNEEQRKKTEYWNGYMVPNNADYEVIANLQLDFSIKYRANLSLTRGKEAGDFSDMHVRLLRIFQPHLSRLIREYIDQNISENGPLSSRDYNCVGFCVLNDSCQVIKQNGIFDRLNTNVNNQLLNKIVSLCVNYANSNNTVGTFSYEYKLENSPLFLELSCVPSNLDGSKVQYCCLVYDISHFFDIALKQAKEKYELSDREYDILLCMLHGMKNEEIAEELYLSVPTIKKYVANIYSKLNITSQKQIFVKLNLL